MRKYIWLYAIALILVPVAFVTFVSAAYALAGGGLPFIGIHALKWWVAFALLLLSGASCVFFAHRRQPVGRVVWPLVYSVGMAVALMAAHLTVACKHGDCL
jgi:hypothetical protein